MHIKPGAGQEKGGAYSVSHGPFVHFFIGPNQPVADTDFSACLSPLVIYGKIQLYLKNKMNK